MSSEHFLVTGAFGCIGAWIVHELVRENASVVALDIGGDAGRLRLLLDEADLDRVRRVAVDVTDLGALGHTLDEHAVTNVIHLAALQVPFCRADPPLGALVNVVGTVNVFEAVKQRAERMAPLVYASSVAAYDALEQGVAPAMSRFPSTLYGVYKRANEGTASSYWADDDVASIGLRPHTVYGVGRDQGMTSEPTRAMLHAAAGLPHVIPYAGSSQLQYARDVARAFIAASRTQYVGAGVFDLGGRTVDVGEIVDAIVAAAPAASGAITFTGTSLPFPSDLDGGALEAVTGPLPETTLEDGVRETVDRFRALLADGRLRIPSMPAEVRTPL